MTFRTAQLSSGRIVLRGGVEDVRIIASGLRAYHGTDAGTAFFSPYVTNPTIFSHLKLWIAAGTYLNITIKHVNDLLQFS